jgi:hypothetical protein
LFVAGIYRPEVVRAKPLFRLACVLFALSLLISPTLNFLLGYLLRLSGPAGPTYSRLGGETAVLLSFPTMMSAVLFGLSVICGLCSLGVGTASGAAAKTPQSIAALGPHSTASPPTVQPVPRRTASPGGVHPLDEPD